MGGEPARSLQFDTRGVAGDRAYQLVDQAGKIVTARELPAMLRWGASYPEHPDDQLGLDELPPAQLCSPDGNRLGWDDARLPQALSDTLGRTLSVRRDPALRPDLQDSILVTFQSTLDALSAALEQPVDLRRFRTNLHLQFDAAAFAEEGWEGRRLQVGEHTLQLLHPCVRCVIPTRDPDTQVRNPGLLRWLHDHHSSWFGINARALGPGRVQVGDSVRLLD